MNLQMSCQRHCLRTFRPRVQLGRGLHIGTKVAGLLAICLLSASLTYGVGPIGSPTPPPAPQVPPVISEDYSADLNGNRINDTLETAARTKGEFSVASAEEEMVGVELVFKEPVTQHQIDEFLRLGGRITYIYKAISYGWTGRIPRESIGSLPSAMGSTLVQVEAIRRLGAYMDVATQTSRIRPMWKAGFAGSQTGFSGDPNTTIGFVGSGVDATHTDLRGRGVYWRDFSDDNEPKPVDYEGHESAVAGVALGTGASGGVDAGTLRYTYQNRWPSYLHMAYPLCPPPGTVTIRSVATWTGPTAYLVHFSWSRGTVSSSLKALGLYMRGPSPQTIANTLNLTSNDPISVTLAELDNLKNMGNVVITTSVSPYPGVGDGFNKFRGVAPGCKWAAAKVLNKDGNADSEQFTAAFDDMVVHRKELNLKVINISFGLEDELGFPEESTALRDKVNSIVNNGIIVVAAAGNNATKSSTSWRKMADPSRAAQVITVGATNDENGLTEYSNFGFPNPRKDTGEDFKPDVVAPGGSQYYSGIMSVDSGTSDASNPDKEPNDYTNEGGTSFAAPFVAGSAALVIQAMERQGIKWGFDSAQQPQYVKMLLCATGSELNAKREGTDRSLNPTLNRAAGGPNGFPPGKDQHEGYGLINPDAAVEAVSLTYAPGTTVTADLGGNAFAKRVWAQTMKLAAGHDLDISLTNPATADFDLYLYSAVPSDTGTPIILASSTLAGAGIAESLHYVPNADMTAFVVVKRISGTGTFTLRSTQGGPPIALNIQAACDPNAPATITLKATDDGRPNPPGAISYTILSKPVQGRLELVGGTPITDVPAKLPSFGDKVVYRPPTNWTGQDSFTFCADDGGTAPTGGQSNTATVTVVVRKQITVQYQVMSGADDAYCLKSATMQLVYERELDVGAHIAGMRFYNVTIPQGSTIRGASLQICATGDTSAHHPYFGSMPAVDGLLKGEATDNAAPFGITTQMIAQLATTIASTDWKWTEDKPWGKDEWYESPDIGPIIQEVVDRPGWSSGNALVIIYTVNQLGVEDRIFWSYEGSPSKAAKLTITYQPK